MQLGYLISTNLDSDCIFNMNVNIKSIFSFVIFFLKKTMKRTCYKDSLIYQGLPDIALNDLT